MNTPAETTVRRMIPADLDAVVALDHLSFSDPWPHSAWKAMLDDPHAYVWVVESIDPIPLNNPQLIGALAVWLVLDELHIGTIAIHPDRRQQGIGRKLLEVGLRESIQLGATLSHLEVRKSNLPAQRLYQNFGFEVVGERKKYYPNDQEDAILMSVLHLGEDYLRWLDTGQPGMFMPKL